MSSALRPERNLSSVSLKLALVGEPGRGESGGEYVPGPGVPDHGSGLSSCCAPVERPLLGDAVIGAAAGATGLAKRGDVEKVKAREVSIESRRALDS